MPELPEVQTVLTTLRPRLLGLRIERVEVFYEKIIKSPQPHEFIAGLQGRSINGMGRRGKYLLLELDGTHLLAVHLRMTGRLVYSSPDAIRDKHTHLVFYLNNEDELRYHDLRKFGTMNLMPVEDFAKFCSQKDLGPDALDPCLTQDLFEKRFQGRRGQIKKLLLDQSLVTGIGNIYANEILWKARIQPERAVETLESVDMEELYRSMRSVLQDAVAGRGTTLSDYVDGEGNPGSYQSQLSVHGREGEPCPECGKVIIRLKTGGRSAFVCTNCQR